jgi:XTP/dITP diphosphohydrolase
MIVTLASRNAHKIAELRRMRPDIDWRPLPVELPDPPETGETFEANSLQKARFAFAHVGGVALADDSGLEVLALGGQPGVRSRRFSPEGTDVANNELLLARLAGLTSRGAAYRCVLAAVGPGGEATCEGACAGTIGLAPRGSGGFGYDPLFWPDDRPGRTMAELSAPEKDAISHRGRAMQHLSAILARAS